MLFTSNGAYVDAPAAMAEDRLLWVLRDHFALKGPKYGCGVGTFGACVLHVDGRAERACLLTPKDVEGKSLTTLEGLGAGSSDGLHPVQAAWIEASAPQCGYCHNGQVMTAAALLIENPAASPAEIAAAIDEVICRCGTQARVKAAVEIAKRKMRKAA